MGRLSNEAPFPFRDLRDLSGNPTNQALTPKRHEISPLREFQIASYSSKTPCFGERIRSEAFAGQKRGFADFNPVLAE